MILESRDGNRLEQWMLKLIDGGKVDSFTSYDIPPVLDHRIRISEDLSLSLQGPREDLSVSFHFGSHQISINKLTPQNVRFAVEGSGLSYSRVSTNVQKRIITIPAGYDHRVAVPYGLLHGIGRLEVIGNPDRNELSEESHKLLRESIANMQAYGVALISKQDVKRAQELTAWNFVADEERDSTEHALRHLNDLLAAGVNPIPGITRYEQLANMINSSEILRTRQQAIFDPRKVEKQLHIPMTVSVDRVRKLVSNLPH